MLLLPGDPQRVAAILACRDLDARELPVEPILQGLFHHGGRGGSREIVPCGSLLERDRLLEFAGVNRWWAMQGLNLRPLPCEGSALPLS